MSSDDNSTSKIGYDDGSYYETSIDPATEKVIMTYYDQSNKVYISYESSSGESTLYDNSGKKCYTIKARTIEGDIIILNDKIYIIHEDEIWTCSNGST